jgi:hypothetical protein
VVLFGAQMVLQNLCVKKPTIIMRKWWVNVGGTELESVTSTMSTKLSHSLAWKVYCDLLRNARIGGKRKGVWCYFGAANP